MRKFFRAETAWLVMLVFNCLYFSVTYPYVGVVTTIFTVIAFWCKYSRLVKVDLDKRIVIGMRKFVDFDFKLKWLVMVAMIAISIHNIFLFFGFKPIYGRRP